MNTETFITDYLDLADTDTTDKVLAIEKALNLPLGEEARKLLSAIETSATGLELDEWRVSPDAITDYRRDAAVNVVEQAILADQDNFLGTRLIEMLTNTVWIGSLGNGDGFFLNLDRDDEDAAADNKSGHVIYFNHDTFDFEFVFADDLSTLIELADLLESHTQGWIEEDEVIAAMERLKDKANLSWHYAALEEVSEVNPSWTGDDNARHLMYRGLWLVYLLRQDGINGMDTVGNMFGQVARDLVLGEPSKFIEGFTDSSPASASYWLWHLFFLDKPDHLSGLMTRFKDHPSTVVQDTLALIREFQAGRKALGKIEDIHQIKTDLLALDVDPDRKEAREAEQKKAAAAEKRRQKAAAAAAQKIIEATPIEGLVDLAWQHLDNPIVVGNIYLHLRANDPSMALDFARYDFVAERRFDRNNSIYDFEGDEVRDAMLHDSPRMHPWLVVQGFAVDSPVLATHLAKTLANATTKALSAHLRMLAHVAVPSLEAALIGLIPKPMVKDTPDNEHVMYALRDVCPALARIKSSAAVPHLIAHADRLKALSQSKSPETAARMRMYLYDELVPLLIDTFRDIGTPECAAFIKTWLGTQLDDPATQALIEMGDKDIVARLEANIGSISGSPVKTTWPKVLLAYAQSRAGIPAEIESAKLALRMQMHEAGKTEALHKMALYVLARNGQPAEVRDLMLPFVDYADPEVRAIVVDTFSGWGEEIELTFMDMGHVSHLYETGGRDALIPYLESDFVVYQYEILRKLGEEEGASIGLEDRIIRVANKLTRFDFYTQNWKSENLRDGSYAIYALAAMQNTTIDDFVHHLMGHPNVIYRENDLFKHKNYAHSPYLAQLMDQPPEVRKAEAPGATSRQTLSVARLGDAPWRLGCQINGISCSPTDGSTAVAGGEKNVVFAADGSLKFQLGQGGWCYDVHHSPDGKLIAAGYQGGVAVLYSAEDGRQLRRLNKHSSAYDVRKVKFSPDGSLIATASDDRDVRIWQVSDGKPLECYTFKSDANTVDWFPDQTRLLVGTDNGLEVVDRATPKAKRTSLKTGSVCDIQFTTIDGQLRIASNGGDAVHLFDERLTALEKLRQGRISRIRFSPDGAKLYVASWEGKDAGLSVWDLATRHRTVLEASANLSLFGLDINPQTCEVIVGGKGTPLQRYSMTGEPVSGVAPIGHNDKLVDMVQLPGTGKLYSVDESGHVIEWGQDNQGTLLFHSPEINSVEAMSASADGDMLMLGVYRCFVQIHPVARAAHTTVLKERCNAVVQTDPANTYLAVYRSLMHLESGAVVQELGHKLSFAVLASKRGQLITAPYLEKTITVLGVPKMEVLKQFELPMANHGIYHMIGDHAQDRLYCACSDQVVRGYDLSNWEIVTQIMLDGSPGRLAISPSDQTLAIAIKGTLALHDLETGQLIAQKDLGDEITCLCFVDEDCVAVGNECGAVFKCTIDPVGSGD